MNLIEKYRERVEQHYENIRLRIKNIKENTSWLPTREEAPHVWARLEQLDSMSREELISEIEADVILLTDTTEYLNAQIEHIEKLWTETEQRAKEAGIID